jgi:hypothetical protein
MDIKGFKERCFNLATRTKGADHTALAKLIGISERQLRRYYDVNDTAMPTVAQMGTICKTFNLSMDALMFPDRFPNAIGHRQTAYLRDALQAINAHLALVIIDEDLNIFGVTPLFAKLYDTTAPEMAGTNMFKDWIKPGGAGYDWVPDLHVNRRNSVVEILMAVAKDAGVSSQMVWFMSSAGDLRRVLMRCFYLEDTGHYMFIDVPVDDAAEDYMGKAAHKNEDGEFCITVGEKCRTLEDTSVLGMFMSGWDIGRTAGYLGWKRERVLDVLDQYRETFGAADFDQMREYIWEWISNEKIFDPLALVRCNSTALV